MQVIFSVSYFHAGNRPIFGFFVTVLLTSYIQDQVYLRRYCNCVVYTTICIDSNKLLVRRFRPSRYNSNKLVTEKSNWNFYYWAKWIPLVILQRMLINWGEFCLHHSALSCYDRYSKTSARWHFLFLGCKCNRWHCRRPVHNRFKQPSIKRDKHTEAET